MKKQFKITNILICSLLICSLGIVGCTQTKNITRKNIPNDTNSSQLEKDQGSTDMKIKPTDRDNLPERADKIAKAITSSIEGINKATVVISERSALVGINLDRGSKGRVLNDELKREVESVVKKTDNKIDTVATSADADLYQRINNIGEGIRKGKPLSDFGNEITEIWNRVVPK